ncbi:hypothetical protein MJL27_26670, partial [Salmonella enterica subsp. enterica serovar Anatum]|nr:hypothetical protein [Salmonella enterica subsp. enterica serovar Anatum]
TENEWGMSVVERIWDRLTAFDSATVGAAQLVYKAHLRTYKVEMFDSSGTLIGVTDKAGLADEKGKFPRMKQALFVDSISSVTGA